MGWGVTVMPVGFSFGFARSNTCQQTQK